MKNHRTFRGLSVIIATLCATLLLFDTQVFAKFNIHLSSIVWNLLVNPDNGELSRDWQIFFAPMPIILLIEMLFSRWSWEKLRSLERQKWLKFVGLVLTCTFIGTHLVYAWADAFVYRPITMQRSNFPLSYPMTARTFLEKQGLLDANAYSQKLAQEGRPDALKLDYPKHSLKFAPLENKANLLIITISGLNAKSISAENTPNLADFAQSSTQFTHHYSTSNNNNAGLVGIFYGLNANYTESILSHRIASPLIEKLHKENYQFGLFSADNFKTQLFKQALLRQEKLKSTPSGNAGAIAAATQFMTLQTAQKPWFALLDLSLTSRNKADFTAQLAALDHQLGTLFAATDFNNTLILITSEQGIDFTQNTQNTFSRQQIHVPLLIFWHALPIGEQTQLSSHVDILPALMRHLFNLENPISDYAQGQDLFELRGDNWVLAENRRTKLIIQPNGTQYQLDNHGNVQKFSPTGEAQKESRPPLGLFLDVLKQESAFFAK